MFTKSFTMRKNKAYGLCSVALAIFILGTAQVKADEVETGEVTATTLVAEMQVEPEGELVSAASSGGGEVAESVSVVTTGSIEVESSGSDGFVSTTTIETTINGSVKEGDQVTYETENLRLTELNGYDVSISDGTVIGTVAGSTVKSPADEQVAGATNLAPSANRSKVVVTFNDKVNELENISYSLKYRGSTQAVLSDRPYEMTASVKDSSGNIISSPVTISATSAVNLKDSYVYLSQGGSVSTAKPDGSLTSQLIYGLYTAAEEPISKGEKIELTLGDSPLIYDDSSLKVGDTVSLKALRLNTGSNVDENGIIIVSKENPEFKVLSISDKVISFEVLSDFLEKDGWYGYFTVPAILVDDTAINENKTLIKGVEYATKVGTKSGDQTLTQTLDLPIQGGSALGNGVRIPRFNVKVVHVSENGEILEAEKVEVSEAKVGSNYSTAAKTFEGYELTRQPENASGVVGRADVLVTYVYRVSNAPLTVRYVDESGKDLMPSVKEEMKIGTSYTTSKQNVPDYDLVKIPDNAQGTMTKNGVTVTYVYKLKSGQHVTRFVDRKGNELAAPVTTVGTVREFYRSEPKDVKNYTLVSSETTGSLTGNYTVDGTVTTFVYDLNDGTVRVKYVTEGGKDLNQGWTKIEGGIGLPYKTEQLKFEGYELVKVQGNKTGEFKENEQEVVYVYKEIFAPVVKEETKSPSGTTKTIIEKPMPVQSSTPTQSSPQSPALSAQQVTQVLPNTGEASGLLVTVTGALTSVMGLIGLGKRKEIK